MFRGRDAQPPVSLEGGADRLVVGRVADTLLQFELNLDLFAHSDRMVIENIRFELPLPDRFDRSLRQCQRAVLDYKILHVSLFVDHGLKHYRTFDPGRLRDTRIDGSRTDSKVTSAHAARPRVRRSCRSGGKQQAAYLSRAFV